MFQNVKKILLKNKRVFRPDHIVYIMAASNISLKRFTGLKGFFTKLSSLMGFGMPDGFNLEEAKPQIAEALCALTNLKKVNYNDQPMEDGHLPALLLPIQTGLTKLSLTRCQLKSSDIKCIADSIHAPTLQILRLDYNDLHNSIVELVDLLHNLDSIATLRMQSCRLKFRDCMQCADALADSTTLRLWNICDNNMFKLRHIKEFLDSCSNVDGLRVVGCKPLDFHVLLGEIVVHSKYAMPEEKKQELYLYGANLNMIVF